MRLCIRIQIREAELIYTDATRFLKNLRFHRHPQDNSTSIDPSFPPSGIMQLYTKHYLRPATTREPCGVARNTNESHDTKVGYTYFREQAPSRNVSPLLPHDVLDTKEQGKGDRSVA